MSKNKQASGIVNVLQYDNYGNVSIVSGSTTLMSVSSSGAVTLTGTLSGGVATSSSYAYTASSAISSYTASSAISSTNALTASSADNMNVRNSLTASAAVISGALTAQTLVVQTITSSIEYSSGSNRFGSQLTDRQTFTGSLNITGSSHAIFGNVGIGTNSPNTILNIVNPSGNSANGYGGNVDDIGMLQIYNNGANTNGASLTVRNYYGTTQVFQWTYAGARIGSRITGSAGSGNVYLTYGQDQVGIFISGSTGNVGIGTTSPLEILDIYRAHPGTSGWSSRSVVRDASYAAFTGVYWNGSASIPAVAAHSSALNAWATLYVNTIDGTSSNGGNVIMGGSVGIGTSSPGYTLDVYGTAKIGSNANNGDTIIKSNSVPLQIQGRATYDRPFMYITWDISPDSGVIIADTLRFNTGASLPTSTGTEKMRIKSDGSVILQNYLNLTDIVSQTDTASTWPVISISGANGTSGINKSSGTYDWGIIKGPTSYGYYGRVVGGFHMASTCDQGFITSGWTMQFIVNGSNGNAFLRGTLTQGSDARIKANVSDLNYGLSEVMQLRAVSYNKKIFNKDKDGNILSESIDTANKYIGFIAQEVKPIIPEIVNGDENSENPERGLSIEYQNMTALLVKAIQELKIENDSLKSRIETLESK